MYVVGQLVRSVDQEREFKPTGVYLPLCLARPPVLSQVRNPDVLEMRLN
jgi:hypothetical protein